MNDTLIPDSSLVAVITQDEYNLDVAERLVNFYKHN